jgi:hypothetical protein
MAVPDDADWDDVLRRAGELSTRAAPLFTRRVMLLALAACIAVAAAAVVFSGLIRSSHTVPRGASRPLAYTPIMLRFTHGAQGITSIHVTVNAPNRAESMRLQVLRGNPYGPDSGRKVVFQEQVSMTNIESPAAGPPRTVALSTWSGTLSPSDWEGGCEKALYTVRASNSVQITDAPWFSCSPR